MKISNCISLFFALFITLGSISHIIADTKSISSPNIPSNKDLQTEYDHVVRSIVKQLDILNLTLQDIGLDIKNNHLNVKDKKEVSNGIMLLSELITALSNEASAWRYAAADIASLHVITRCLQALTTHLSAALHNGLDKLPPFDIANIQLRTVGDTLTLDDIKKDIEQVDKQLEQLKKNADNAGLDWYNRWYRKIDKYAIQPSHKYKLLPISIISLLSASVAMLIWYHSDSKNEILRKGLKIFGRPLFGDQPIIPSSGVLFPEDSKSTLFDRPLFRDQPILPSGVQYSKNSKSTLFSPASFKNQPTIPSGGVQEDSKCTGWVTILDYYRIKYASGHMPNLAMLSSIVLPIYKDRLISFGSWTKKYILNRHNFMLGGIYKKQEFNERKEIHPDVTFDDVIGMEYEKELFRDVINYIVNPEVYDQKKLTPEKGYLFTGPTRTGKTFFAEAVCGEIEKALKAKGGEKKYKYFKIPAPLIINQGFAYFAAMADEESPCAIFIDEIDLLGLQRAGGDRKLLREFLICLSLWLSCNPKEQVIIFAATNKPENLDFALNTTGRLGTDIRFEYPCFQDRKTFLQKQLNIPGINFNLFNIDKLTRELENQSYETVEKMVRNAIRKSKNKGKVLSQQHLEESLNEHIRGILVENKDFPEQETQLLAAHQAGHALATMLLNSSEKCAMVTIQPVIVKLKEESAWDQYYQKDEQKQKPIEHGKMFTYHEQDTLYINSKDEKYKLCQIKLAGHVAEQLLLGSCGYSYHKEDKQQALEIAKSIAFEGINTDQLPKHIKNVFFDKAFAILNECEQQITALLKHHEDDLHALAQALQEKQTLTAEEINLILHPDAVDEAEDKNANQTEKAISKALEQEFGIKEVYPTAEVQQEAA